MKVVWTEQAWRRLSEIEEFVASDRPAAAAKLIDKLIDRGDGLAAHPDRGRKLPELPGSGLRELVVDRYRIVYRRTASTVAGNCRGPNEPSQSGVHLGVRAPAKTGEVAANGSFVR